MYDLDIWNTVSPPVGTVYGYPPGGDEQTVDRRRARAHGSRRPDLQPGHQYRDDFQVHARRRETQRRDQVGGERTRSNAARLIHHVQRGGDGASYRARSPID